jgi:hypothetical protein
MLSDMTSAVMRRMQASELNRLAEADKRRNRTAHGLRGFVDARFWPCRRAARLRSTFRDWAVAEQGIDQICRNGAGP